MDDYQYDCPDELEVAVSALFRKDNKVRPVSVWIDGIEYTTKVFEEIKGETLKQRGSGIRYKVRVTGEEFSRESYLFRIGDQWYLAEQLDDSIPDIQTRYIGMRYHGKKVIDERYDNPYKVAVNVAAVFHLSGEVEPFTFWWEDGTQYNVDRVVGRERAASLKAGIIGMRYTIQVLGRETFLFRDDDLWWMERKRKCRVLDVHGQPIN